MNSRGVRRPVRAAFALAGAGSLGTFIAGALRELLTAIRGHNEAIADPAATDDDPRLIHSEWGQIVIDAVGGSSAGALCAGQLVKALFEPGYAGGAGPTDEPGTITGDWIDKGAFDRLAGKGNRAHRSGPVESPGWTLLSAAKLHDVAMEVLRPSVQWSDALSSAGCAVDPTGLVAVGITLTDLLGYHEHADFEPGRVLGHPDFGASSPERPHFRGFGDELVRDLGVRRHSEIRRVFVGGRPESTEFVTRFLRLTRRQGRGRAVPYADAAERLASLAAASAALPLALGPMALTDRAVDAESTVRRLYMDGGVLNNKPIAPALRLARWHDELRLLSRLPDGATSIPLEVIEEELVYERVCFFLDAFPDRTRGEWRSPHPDQALRAEAVAQLAPEAIRERDARIDDALSSPTRGLGAFFESLLASLRAQDIRGIAELNFRARERDRYIAHLCTCSHQGSSQFAVTDLERAHAYAAVRSTSEGAALGEPEALAVADAVWQAERFGGLGGRRSVTMIPVFAPENLVAVLAGEGLYAVGGLLAREARVHDAEVGRVVARHVIDALRAPEDVPRVLLPDAPLDVVPQDTARLVERLKVAAEAAVQGDGSGSAFIRSLVAFPLHLNPLVRLIKARLDRKVRGLPEE